jgi:hypothetical protein
MELHSPLTFIMLQSYKNDLNMLDVSIIHNLLSFVSIRPLQSSCNPFKNAIAKLL